MTAERGGNRSLLLRVRTLLDNTRNVVPDDSHTMKEIKAMLAELDAELAADGCHGCGDIHDPADHETDEERFNPGRCPSCGGTGPDAVDTSDEGQPEAACGDEWHDPAGEGILAGMVSHDLP